MTEHWAERLAAARGAAFLDRAEPGWHQRVGAAALNIGLCDSCVLGQLYGDYDIGLLMYRMSQEMAAGLGFDTEDSSTGSYPALTAAWRDLIRERLVRDGDIGEEIPGTRREYEPVNVPDREPEPEAPEREPEPAGEPEKVPA